MEKKTIFKLAFSGAAVIAAVLFGTGIIGGRAMTYQLPAPYTAESTNDFSTVKVEATIQGDRITDCAITSWGDSDLLNDEIRAEWADAIVQAQSADADAITGATLTFSAASVQEATNDILVQAGLREATPEPEPTAEPEPAAEPEEADGTEAEAGGYTDGVYSVQKVTDFSTINVEIAVDNGAIVDASVTSEGANDLLTDDNRDAWASQIVEKQDVDAISGVTVSSNAVKEAVGELLAQAGNATGAEAADDGKVAELEAALAEANAKIAELEAAAAASEAAAKAAEKAQTAEAAPETAEVASGDASRMMRPRPVALTQSAPAEAAEAAGGDASRMMRPHPVTLAQSAPAEAAETTGGDASRMMRPRPVTLAQSAPAEAAEAAGGDASRMMRPRPAAQSAEAEPETATETAQALEGDARLAAILPHIVTTMGDNRENSYVTDYLEQDPYLVNIYEGYGFAKDYGSARGHEYTLEDLSKTQRPHPKANCITCKTPDLHKLVEQEGVAVYSMPFDEVMAQMTTNVNCYTCHGADDGNGGDLLVTHQYVNEALGDSVAAIKPATMSCGQCHIEYYFTPSDSETMMPYHSVEEMTPEAILAYYDAMDFADWTQESTGTRMLKAQHPELETVLQGKHAAFLSCADCHMPTETTEDGVAYRSHLLISPLDSEALLETCAQCHGDTDMAVFVHDIQAKVTARETELGNRLSEMKDALAAAVASGNWSEEELDAVRKLHREAQWFFDFCYVENSEGAHNSELSMHCLDTAEAKIDEAMALLGAKPAETA